MTLDTGRERGRIIGLTGGIASGKSLAADTFSSLGIPVIDTDRVSRELVEPGSPCWQAIRDHFGDAIIADDGRLDRQALRRRILDQPQERRALEAILHPAIRERTRTLAETAARSAPYVIVVVPLLAEHSVWPAYRDWLDAVITVTAAMDRRRERLLTRPGIDAEQAERLFAAQTSDEQRLAISDYHLDNSADREALRQAVTSLDQRLRQGEQPA
ncbi:MAG: dephospho-CoA kinase [Pseudomonadota bacterium]